MLALLGLAVLVRLLFLGGIVDRDLPFSIFYYGDSRLYREFALAILRGESFDQGIPYHPPLLAYLLAAVIRTTGENPWALRALVSVLGGFAVPLTWFLGLQLWDRGVALLAALMATFSFGLSVVGVSPNTEAIYIPILLAQALALISLGDAIGSASDESRTSPRAPDLEGRTAAESGPVRSHPEAPARKILLLSLVSGLLLGLGSLTRAEHLGLGILLPAALAIGWPRAGWRRIARASAIMVATGAFVIAPWAVHNSIAIGRFNRANPDLAEPLPVFVLVSNYGALNFALANNAGADGGFKPDLIVGGTGGAALDLKDPRQLRLYLHGYAEGVSYLAHNPGDAVRLAARKLAISAGALSLGFGISNWPSGLTGRRRAVDIFVPDAIWFLPLSLSLLIAGLWISRRVWRRGSAIWLIGCHKVLICLAFFGYARLFVQLLPFVYLLQAAALLAAVRWLAGAGVPAVRRGSTLLGLLLAGLLLLELCLAVGRPRNFNAAGSADGATGKLLQDAEIRLSPKP